MADQSNAAVTLMDESFNPQDARNCGLAIILNERAISFAILDLKRNKFLALQRYLAAGMATGGEGAGTMNSFRDFLDAVCTAAPWLRGSFKSVKIAYDGRKSTLVPALLFDLDEKEQYLNFNFKHDQDDLVCSDHLLPLDAWQVFTVPATILDATNDFFPKSRVIHASSLLIESVWINYKNRISTPHVFLHVRDPLFDLMIFDGRQMNYFNTFPFRTAEDVTYYLVFVLEQLGSNPETIPLVLLGDITGNALPELLLRYIRHVETGKRNAAYSYSYVLNHLPPQAYFPLLNFFSCGL